jgi:5-methyltetrahydropteroyltriglutamate--homocysteine methyltransferase
MADTYKFRIDHHGSLVRPAEVLTARAQHAAGQLDDAGLRAVEDQAIAEAVRTQRKLGMSVVTDGEFRREDWRSAVFDAVRGFHRTAANRWVAVEELKPYRSLVAEDTAAVAAQTLVPAKASLPAPAFLAAQCFSDGGPYGSVRELGEVLARIVREEIEALIARGIRYVQLTNPGYARHLFGGGDAAALAEAIAIDAAAVHLDGKPDNVCIGLCPAHDATDPVDVEAARLVFEGIPADRFILPYHTGHESELALVEAVPASKDVCLGIVDARTAALEDVEEIMKRMDGAAGVRDVEDIAVSPNAGFSDLAGGAAIGAEVQRRKLVHVETIARMCWGNEL